MIEACFNIVVMLLAGCVFSNMGFLLTKHDSWKSQMAFHCMAMAMIIVLIIKSAFEPNPVEHTMNMGMVLLGYVSYLSWKWPLSKKDIPLSM